MRPLKGRAGQGEEGGKDARGDRVGSAHASRPPDLVPQPPPGSRTASLPPKATTGHARVQTAAQLLQEDEVVGGLVLGDRLQQRHARVAVDATHVQDLDRSLQNQVRCVRCVRGSKGGPACRRWGCKGNGCPEGRGPSRCPRPQSGGKGASGLYGQETGWDPHAAEKVAAAQLNPGRPDVPTQAIKSHILCRDDGSILLLLGLEIGDGRRLEGIEVVLPGLSVIGWLLGRHGER